ncbi:sensor domain-containing protein [Actinoplanes sp. LDG1-06]|uniref:histidine kinase n=1 Tax=Paractinoplanes ovalisporus TaxID=2810368 RepID=A0ABS2ATE5_9ACTN|nr:sensor histidine kinase [Actinoplanes ovalisporus]MBM2623144.1 sensor domain-containing protein [Actinoplanes ovalisporus]
MRSVETRDWIRDGLRSVAAGALSIVLAILNIPLFALFVVSLALTPVLGIGLVALPGVTALIRLKADLARRVAGWHGVTITRPYRPLPAGVGPVGWKRYRWIVTDPATWRDFAWLLPGAVGGLVLGILTIAIPLYGVQGIVLLPLWLYLGTDWYGYGVNWPIESVGEGFLSLPQGLAFLALGMVVAPWLRRVDGLFAKLFLAPTRAAELRLRVTQLTVTRADTVDAQAAELRRIERDLHDGAQARLVSLGMAIGLAEELVDRDPQTARKLLAEARENSSTALVELRHLVRGIHPPVLAERGLDGAVRALALTSVIPTTVDSDVTGRLETPVESAAYFAVAEALANVQRHSAATFAYVSMHREGDLLRLEVGDDGHGGADKTNGTGLAGMERRLAAFDGTMTLSSPPGGPTIVTMELPCASSSPRTMLSSGTD